MWKVSKTETQYVAMSCDTESSQFQWFWAKALFSECLHTEGLRTLPCLLPTHTRHCKTNTATFGIAMPCPGFATCISERDDLSFFLLRTSVLSFPGAREGQAEAASGDAPDVQGHLRTQVAFEE